MDKTHDTALVIGQMPHRPATPTPQEVDETKAETAEVTPISNLEERFANWGTD